MRLDEVGVLVVDDVNAMRVHIRDLLRESGLTKVSVAPSGPAAKQLLELQPFHLVLADWQMEPTDGMELLTYVRGHPDYKNIAFILVTAENTKEKVLQAIKAGVDDYLVKPITAAQVKTKVFDTLLRKKLI
jgi:two-component system chemotaxis response regulator CheY